MPSSPPSDQPTTPAAHHPIDILRRADWLDHDRVLAYARTFVVVLIVAASGWLALSHNLIDIAGNPVGTDFLNVYAAGLMVNEGNAAAAYDWTAHGAVEHTVIPFDGYFGWHYPPMFLFIAAAFAKLPYLPALALYMAVTFAIYLASIFRLSPDVSGKLWLAAGFPGVFVNLGHGQNGFLTTALLATGLYFLNKRPYVAGMALGALAYKPQFALLIPVALVMGGYWRATIAAGLAACALALASFAAFGMETWSAFFASLEPTRTIVLEQGGTGWQKIVSVFSAIRMWHGSIGMAYAGQTTVTAAVILLVALVWWVSRRPKLNSGLLVLAIPLTTPYLLDYDLVVLSAGVMLLASEGYETGFRPWEKITLALVTLSPLIARGLGTIGLPIVPPLLIFALVMFSLRALRPQVRAA